MPRETCTNIKEVSVPHIFAAAYSIRPQENGWYQEFVKMTSADMIMKAEFNVSMWSGQKNTWNDCPFHRRVVSNIKRPLWLG